MTEQLTLLGEPKLVELTERQQFALEQIERLDGVDADELGALMHERRGKHDASVRCNWCQQEGRGVARELQKKNLVVRRRSGLWQSLRPRRPLEEGEPGGTSGRGAGGSSEASGSSPSSSGAGVGDQATTDDGLSFGEWMETLR